MNAHEANRWVRQRLPRRHIRRGVFTRFAPTTADLRQLLSDASTPRDVRVHIYNWLRYRKERS